MIVIPIAGVNVDWNSLIKELQSQTDSTTLKALDSSNVKTSNYLKFLTVLEELKQQVNTDFNIITTALDHLFFSFLVVASNTTILELNELTDLSILSTKSVNKGLRVSYISGTLGNWKQFVVECSSNKVNQELRFIANSCQEFFFKVGLKPLFSEYSVLKLTDGTRVVKKK